MTTEAVEEVQVEAAHWQPSAPEGWRGKSRWTAEQKRYHRRHRFRVRVARRTWGAVRSVGWFLAVWYLTSWGLRRLDGWLNSTAGHPVEKPLHLHISYNSLTNGKSKWVQVSAPIGEKLDYRYYLQGVVSAADDERFSRVYRCQVSEEFYDVVGENAILDLPASRCQEIAP